MQKILEHANTIRLSPLCPSHGEGERRGFKEHLNLIALIQPALVTGLRKEAIQILIA